MNFRDQLIKILGGLDEDASLIDIGRTVEAFFSEHYEESGYDLDEEDEALEGLCSDQENSPVLHVDVYSTLSASDAIYRVQTNPEMEYILAMSDHFFDFEGDLDSIQTSYEAFFEKYTKELIERLDQPTEKYTRSDYPEADEIHVWELANQPPIYLRIHWPDKEIPIGIALGVRGCSQLAP